MTSVYNLRKNTITRNIIHESLIVWSDELKIVSSDVICLELSSDIASIVLRLNVEHNEGANTILCELDAKGCARGNVGLIVG